MKKLHILGIGGTFMGSLAALAKELNYQVTGSDKQIYPPMSTQLESLGIKFFEGYGLEPLKLNPDCFVVGNVMTRGMPIIEALLNEKRSFLSGPEWLAKNILKNRHVLAVSGTHGKTTTTSMLAWILEYAGLNPGFLIGGVANNFDVSARLGSGQYFVVEADEYDCAFFDKRSKFIHYQPSTLIMNNIEFDHADIFPNLAAIQTQFHHLLRTIPANGLVIYPESDIAIQEVIDMGCWTPRTTLGFSTNASWYAKNNDAAGNTFEVWFDNTQPANTNCAIAKPANTKYKNTKSENAKSGNTQFDGTKLGTVTWDLLGQHNISNALAAIAAAQHVNVAPSIAIEALCYFKGVKRRLEVKGCINNITVYDDFAHHPTAIKTTLQGLRAKLGEKTRIIVAIDLRSNTMRAGHHKQELSTAFDMADVVYFYKTPDIDWDVETLWKSTKKGGGVYAHLQRMLQALENISLSGDHVVFMSNGGFSNSQMAFLNLLKRRFSHFARE